MSPMRALSIAAMLCATAGCHRFKEARPDRPNTIVTLRLTHHETSASRRYERVIWNGRALPIHSSCKNLSRRTPCDWTVRVEPGPTTWLFHAEYYDAHRTLEREEYSDRVPYTVKVRESKRGSDGRSETYIVEETRYKTVIKQRTKRNADVTNVQACTSGTAFNARAGGSYLVVFDFFGSKQCAARCLEVVDDSTQRRFSPCADQIERRLQASTARHSSADVEARP